MTSIIYAFMLFAGLLCSITLAIIIGHKFGQLGNIPVNQRLRYDAIFGSPFLLGLLSGFFSTLLNFAWFMALDSEIKKGFTEVALEQILKLANVKFFSGLNAKEQMISVIEAAQIRINPDYVYSSSAINGLDKLLRTENLEMVTRLLFIIPKISNC